MDYRPAEFVRVLGADESLGDLVNEARGETWHRAQEHAVVVLDDGRSAMIRGGLDGILLSVTPGVGVTLDVDGVAHRVVRLAWHTHPRPTGPSDHDRDLLRLLGQQLSVVYEIGGDVAGTIFRPKRTPPLGTGQEEA